MDKFSGLEGKAGPYILHSTVRINSLLNKAKDIEYKEYKMYQNKTDKDIIFMSTDDALKKHPELFQLEEDLKLLQQAILKERTKEDGDSYHLEIEYKNKLTLFKEHPLIVNYLEDKEQLIAYLEYMQTYIQGLLD